MKTKTAREIIAEVAEETGWTVFKPNSDFQKTEYRRGNRHIMITWNVYGRVVESSRGNRNKGWWIGPNAKEKIIMFMRTDRW